MSRSIQLARSYVQDALDRLIGAYGEYDPDDSGDANMAIHDLTVAMVRFDRAGRESLSERPENEK